MKTLLTTLLVGIATLGIVFPWNTALAYDPYDPYYYTYPPYQQPVTTYQPEQAALLQQLLQLIQQLQMQLQNQGGTYYPPVYGGGYTFEPTTGSSGSNYYGYLPEVETNKARDIEDNSAELQGEVDMNDYEHGVVFFVYGQDEDMIEDVEKDYDEYDDVKDDEEENDFEVIRIHQNFEGKDDFEEKVSGLREDEEYYFSLCVEYKNPNNSYDRNIICGDLEDFETDGDYNTNDEEPRAESFSASNIEDNSAKLRGEVDMNDYDNGLVFFVYGEDENQIEDVKDDYDTYSDIDVDGDNLRKVILDDDLDGFEYYTEEVDDLDSNTDIYFTICVQYENDDNDDELECGNVKHFETN